MEATKGNSAGARPTYCIPNPVLIHHILGLLGVSMAIIAPMAIAFQLAPLAPLSLSYAFLPHQCFNFEDRPRAFSAPPPPRRLERSQSAGTTPRNVVVLATWMTYYAKSLR